MSIKITSPIENYSETTFLGSLELKFDKSVAKVDELSDAQKQYLLGAGYTVAGETIEQPEPAAPVDSRDFDQPIQVGTPLRDAAVDPEPGDFLAPTNAGKADPHGPDVVSPEVHASQGVRPVKGGDVHVDDPEVQDKLETEHAANVTDGTPVTAVPEPNRNASKADWVTFAGLDEETAKSLTRDQIIEQHGSKA